MEFAQLLFSSFDAVSRLHTKTTMRLPQKNNLFLLFVSFLHKLNHFPPSIQYYRYNNTPLTELSNTAEEQFKITQLRLLNILSAKREGGSTATKRAGQILLHIVAGENEERLRNGHRRFLTYYQGVSLSLHHHAAHHQQHLSPPTVNQLTPTLPPTTTFSTLC